MLFTASAVRRRKISRRTQVSVLTGIEDMVSGFQQFLALTGNKWVGEVEFVKERLVI